LSARQGKKQRKIHSGGITGQATLNQADYNFVDFLQIELIGGAFGVLLADPA
jgi:hypothetical protein